VQGDWCYGRGDGGEVAAGQPSLCGDKTRRGPYKAGAITMIQRATLEEIAKATAWQKHTARGFISILGSKGGMKVTSKRRESDGARLYEA
jgi:hypothetical protein